MSLRTDRDYLLGRQYRDSTNLNARLSIHQRFSVNRYGWHRWIFDQFDGRDYNRILELGSGNGELWLEFRRVLFRSLQNIARIPPGWRITITDLSAGMLEEASERLSHVPQVVEASVVDAQELPFASRSFDVVIANAMLYHVPDRPRAFREIRGVLDPDGTLYAATFGADHMWELDALVNGSDDDFGYGSEFTLENGSEQLNQFFDNVRLVRYEDALEVTDPEAAIAYLGSTRRVHGLGPGAHKLVADRVYGHFRRSPVLHVTKSAGMFIARGPSHI